jgi:uncharacterized membrane protein
MLQISTHRLAQVAIGVLIVIVIRALSEVLLMYNPASLSSGAQQKVYIIGSLAAAVATLAAHILHAFRRDWLVLVVTAVTTISLLVYKITQPL